jgi:hypothetical protein
VRDLLDPAQVAVLVDGIDRAIEAFDLRQGGGEADPAWFTPFDPGDGGRLAADRRRARAGGSIWAADSPRALFDLVDVLDRTGIRDLASEVLGERPVLSMKKCTLRRVPLDSLYAGWHQDGAFLGEDLRSLNAWLCLTDCGQDAPGLELVPRRLPGLAATGTEGAIFPWTVAPAVVDEVAGEAGTVRPQFRAGDVLLFDHLFLHRTATTASMVRERHAVETWMFAASAYPGGAVPLVL